MNNSYSLDLKDEVRPLAFVPFENNPLNRLSEFTPSAWSELYHRNISIMHTHYAKCFTLPFLKPAPPVI